MSRQTFSKTKFYSRGVKPRFDVFAMLEIAALSKVELSSCAVEDCVVKIPEASAARLASNGSALVLHIFGNKDLFWSLPYPFLHGFSILRNPTIQACSASSYGSKQPFSPLASRRPFAWTHLCLSAPFLA